MPGRLVFPVVLAWAAGGCVLPLAPEFEEERNLSPVVVDVTPPIGSIVRDPESVFEALLQDPNPNDLLYIRWLIDYPPYDADTSRIWEPSPLPNPERASFRPDCRHNAISPTVMPHHRLMLVVSDRPFVVRSGDQGSPDRIFDETPADANVVRLTWQFEKDCR